MPTTKCKVKFSKVLQSLYAKSKNKSDTFTYTFSRNHALILHSKVIFEKLVWLKFVTLKNTLHALNSLITRGNKRSHVLKETYSF